MNKKILIMIVFCLSAFGMTAYAQDYSWRLSLMDGGRTGCVSAAKDNVPQSMGAVYDGVYYSPSGNVFGPTTATSKVAQLVIGAQPRMTYVKDVIAFAPEAMTLKYPESSLSNWYVDIIMEKVAELSGKKIDMGLCNFGGIRAEIPQGKVILDDILSMFPFDNNLYYVEIYGRDLRKLFDEMAERKLIEVLGGVKVVAEGKKIVSVHVGGQPLEDDRLYSVATISFLYKGGDNIVLSGISVNPQSYDVLIRDAVLERVLALTAAGKNIEYKEDGRVVVR